MVEARYAPYRDWALTENREAGDFELWHKWLLPEMDAGALEKVCHELTFQYRQAKGKRRVVDGGLQVIRGLYERGYRLGVVGHADAFLRLQPQLLAAQTVDLRVRLTDAAHGGEDHGAEILGQTVLPEPVGDLVLSDEVGDDPPHRDAGLPDQGHSRAAGPVPAQGLRGTYSDF